VSDFRSNSETARDYAAGTSVIHYQIFFQCIKKEGESSRDGSDESFIQLREGLFGVTRRCRVL